MLALKILFAFFFIGFGILVFKHANLTQPLVQFLRSNTANFLFFGAAGLWFLFHIYHLHPANFGEYRTLFLFLFSLIIICSLLYVKDFLSVRGIAILLLLFMDVLLQSTYLHFSFSHLFLNTLAYLVIFLALLLGTLPYVLRDFFLRLPHYPKLTKAVALFSVFTGTSLMVSFFF